MSKLLSSVFLTMVVLTTGTARADQFFPSNATNFTRTTAEIDTTIDSTVARTVQSFKTELDFGFAGGPALSQQIFFVSVSDPAFQVAIAAAVTTLVSSGAVSTSGPTQVSNTTSSKTGKQTIETGRSSTLTFSIGEYVGPATYTSGDRGLCQSSTLVNTTPGLTGGTGPGNTYPLLSGCTGGVPSKVTVDFGGIVIDSLYLTNTAIATTTTTTTTNLLSEVYRIDGVSAVAVPEPGSVAVLAAGLLVLVRARLARHQHM